MNEKTAKLINKYALAKGSNAKSIKREWNTLTAREKYERRQAMLKELQGNS
ncbi:MAG: hypothetical protein KDK39_11190 [Leptospiraceae bacterium]|nr:hypothetical protein [Leptospiraceae bacterium]